MTGRFASASYYPTATCASRRGDRIGNVDGPMDFAGVPKGILVG
jgi:hypothetical protein